MNARELTELRRTILAKDLKGLRALADARGPEAAFASMALALKTAGPRAAAYATQARRTLERLVGSNRKARHLIRDALVVEGNALARVRRYDEALDRYRKARLGESDAARRALVDVNIAKVHVARVEFYPALTRLELVGDGAPPALASSAFLLKARVLLAAGADDAALELIRRSRGADLPSSKVDLERRYLGFVARINAKSLAELPRRVDELRSWLDGKFDERVAAFYELEALLFRQLGARDTIANRRRHLERARYVGKRAKARSLVRAIEAVDALLGRRRAAGAEDEAFAALNALKRQDHLLTYQYASLLLAHAELQARRPELAARLLKGVQASWDWCLAGFSPRIVAELRQRPNELPRWVDAMIARLPPRVRDQHLLADVRALRLLRS